MICETETEKKFITLVCPECGEPTSIIREEKQRGIVTVIFKCMFSATLNSNITVEEAQRILDEFKTSGRMEAWLKQGLF